MNSGEDDSKNGQYTLWGWTPMYPSTISSHELDKKCECGSNITYGENCPPEFHSRWCPLFKKEET